MDLNRKAPVVIGGVGGSGTRIVAKLMMDMNFYMGSDLNRANDNLWLSFLFKRPQWYDVKHPTNSEDINLGLTVLKKAMLRQGTWQQKEFEFVLKAAFDTIRYRSRVGSLIRAKNILTRPRQFDKTYRGWGWKAPVSHIYLDYLDKYFSELKYIHVIRNGLDMAFSQNQEQLYEWGHLFNIDINTTDENLPQKSLDFWIASNQRVLNIGKQMDPSRFLILHFEEVCINPIQEIQKLIDFLNIDATDLDLEKLAEPIALPASTNRYKKHDLAMFSTEQIEAVKSLGCKVDI